MIAFGMFLNKSLLLLFFSFLLVTIFDKENSNIFLKMLIFAKICHLSPFAVFYAVIFDDFAYFNNKNYE